MSASNVYINWEGASFTPSGSGAVSINKVTSCKPSRGGSMEGFKGDLNLFWLVCAVPTQTRTFEVTTGDVGALLGIAIGSRGSFSIVLADAVACGIPVIGANIPWLDDDYQASPTDVIQIANVLHHTWIKSGNETVQERQRRTLIQYVRKSSEMWEHYLKWEPRRPHGGSDSNC